MKIAFLLPSLKPTGPVRVALDLGRLFAQSHEVWYFYFDDLPGNQKMENGRHLSFKETQTFEGFDIIHSHGLRPDAYIRLHHNVIVPKKITTIHNYVQEDLRYQYNILVSLVFSKVWKWATARHDVITVLSHDMKAYYQKLFGPRNYAVVPNTRVVPHAGRDPEIEATILDFKGEDVLLGNASYVTPRKGLDQVIRALTLNDRLRFVHFGEGREIQKLQRLAAEKGVQGRVLFLGFHPNAQAYYNLFDIFVMPSRSEGFPLAMLEAVKAQVPIVSSNLPVFVEIFGEEEVPKFERESAKDLNRVVKLALTKREVLIQNALHKFENEYAPALVKQKYLQLYSQRFAKE